MKSLLIFLSIICLSNSAMALTTPYNTSVLEIKTIIESEDLAKAFGPASKITSINKIQENAYTVTSTYGCELNVYIRGNMELDFGPMTCLAWVETAL